MGQLIGVYSFSFNDGPGRRFKHGQILCIERLDKERVVVSDRHLSQYEIPIRQFSRNIIFLQPSDNNLKYRGDDLTGKKNIIQSQTSFHFIGTGTDGHDAEAERIDVRSVKQWHVLLRVGNCSILHE